MGHKLCRKHDVPRVTLGPDVRVCALCAAEAAAERVRNREQWDKLIQAVEAK